MHFTANIQRIIVIITLVLPTLIGLCKSYHTAGNVRYDCWPLNASKENSGTINCEGLSLVWPEEPPDMVEVGKRFNVTYRALASESFYTRFGAYPGANESFVRNFCTNNTCPVTLGDVTKENCCVWHANIHTCHPTVTSNREICGPWVGDDGSLSTHTDTQYGLIDDSFFAQDVRVDFVGNNFIIAHLRVGNIQIALGKPITVTEKRECGDGLCSSEIGETCETCAVDCCSPSFPLGATVTIVVLCIIVPTVIVLVVIGWYGFQRRKLFYDESWIINYDDVQKESVYRGPMGSLVSFKHMKFITEAESAGTGSHSESTVNIMQKRQLFTQTGVYEGRTVAIKKVNRYDFVLNNAIRREVMQVRTLDHPNLCKFIGATVKDPLNLTVITEYCPKGSLNDVLQNDDIPLNWGFRFSFATDIARGMAYLHSKKMYHGRLTSSNCVLDDRWVVKISDYGLPSFRQEKVVMDSSVDVNQRRRSTVKVYQAPELRGMQNSDPPNPAYDIYSYAIILVEIATRMDPFSEDMVLDSNWKPKIKLSDLTSSDSPCPCPQEYYDVICRCWSFMPQSRPSFDHIKKTVYRINPNKESPVDMMMLMMERYSKHLEALVAERTQELIAEQNKTANLLYSMLPRQVADDLKQGKPAPATSFQSTTIFFSDIVGFTSLASSSTPMQIVKMLNDLYSKFDDILDQFDVYKVETIGDAYMVVSGVPRENGDRHAGEIASMALAFVAECEKFKIPHRVNTKLEIRCGIHSGPVCAGVVGLKMPRYCLFGDTVNTASRMETSSEAMKIQCSDTTYQLLKKIGGFRLECRGNISVKGKGSMLTWWLTGQNNRKGSITGYSIKSPTKQTPRKTGSNIITKETSITSMNGSMNFSRTSSNDSPNDDAFINLPGSVVLEELN